ncbi:MAG TPA: 4'-phosphopantetheinyl transferase superfamily protein [Polyangia bacterium]
MNGEAIDPGEAHLWYTLADEVCDPAHLATLESLLTSEERARRERYRFERDRHQFVVARGLLRWTLSHYLGLPAEALRFRAGPHGKPELDGKPELAVGAAPTALEFNLSHAAGVVACAVARDAEIGIDVEDHAGAADIDAVARSFAPSERADLDAVRGAARQERFLAYWTLKEAYLKARGEGLGLPLDGFAFTLAPASPPRIAFGPAIADNPADWRFAELRLTESAVAAIALRTRFDLAVRVRKTSPFAPGAAPGR